MNERIKELAKQAGAIHIHGKPKDRALVGYDDIEKFAELIVQECTDICEHWDKTVNYTSHGQIIADKIKKHFGVEE